ncbi:MAG TPA: aldose epimerase family protein [Acidobacteriaceae bacterium]|nr:aldose epimerase family protein [Acidobacteriaceae bacterium]
MKQSASWTWKVVAALIIFAGLRGSTMHAAVQKKNFGTMPDGEKIDIYTLKDGPYKARVITYGARLVSLEVPDRDGKVADIVLGYSSLGPYLHDKKTYFGAVVGRYANRIAHGTFVLNGKRYHLPQNENGNTLHGGTVGFDQRVWKAHEVPDGVELELVSKNGDQGFPGTLTTRVRYTLKKNVLSLDYKATSDADTVLNLTNHSYFNLAGEGNGTILGDILTIPAHAYTPVNKGLIPTGQFAPVAGTPFDFLKPMTVGKRINDPNEQLEIAKGYDENFVLPHQNQNGVLQEAARVYEPRSGRVMVVKTTQPGVQFYSGNFLDGTIHGKHGHVYPKHAGLCLETQHFPDSPNHPNFPTTELKPGQIFHQTTEWVFSTEK